MERSMASSEGRGIRMGGVFAGVVLLLGLGLFFSDGAARVWWEVVTLGVVEGLTEFLPISSTGHLLITSRLLRFSSDIGGTFEIFIQLGAIVAVVLFYARDLLAQARAFPTSAAIRHFWLALVVAFVPAAMVGFFLRKWIKAVLFTSPLVIAVSLIVGGVILIVVEVLPRRRVTTNAVEQTSFGQALSIGVAQILSLVPGVSRSGSSIVGGMLAGMDRRAATAFSFYLAIPVLGAATVLDLLGSLDQLVVDDLVRLAVGTLVSFVVAWASIGWLLRYVAHHRFVSFGIYRIGVGLAVLVLLAFGWL